MNKGRVCLDLLVGQDTSVYETGVEQQNRLLLHT